MKGNIIGQALVTEYDSRITLACLLDSCVLLYICIFSVGVGEVY